MDKPKHEPGSRLEVVEEPSLEAALEAELEGQRDRLVGLVLEGRYRVLERIDSGGIGTVYRAEQVQLKRRVAVKVLHPKYAQNKEFRRRFEREALAASKATHPSCIAVLDLGTVEDRPFLVMEYVEGPLLSDVIDDGGIGLDEAVAIGLQLLEALRHAHRHGIVHRDVKPDNVMLCHPDDAGTQIKLLDFGLAKNVVPDAPDSKAVTRDGTICGTPDYISPEQAVAGQVDARSDLYSLGVVLYEMVCGRKPFLHAEMLQLIQAHLTEPPPRPRGVRPEISPELEEVLLRALQKERERRFQTAEAFIAALRAVPEAGDPGARETVVAPPPYRGVRRLATAATVQANAGEMPSFEGPEPGWAAGEGRAARSGQLLTLLFVAAVASAGTTALIDRHYAPPGLELEQAAQLLEQGKLDRAERQIRAALFREPSSGVLHLILGHIHHRKRQRGDAIEAYRRAIVCSPRLRNDSTMLRHLIADLQSDEAARFLEHTVGPPALPTLQQAAREHERGEIRRRAAQVAQRIGARP